VLWNLSHFTLLASRLHCADNVQWLKFQSQFESPHRAGGSKRNRGRGGAYLVQAKIGSVPVLIT